MHKLSLLPALVLALILMPACGGGGGGDDDDDDIVGGVDASPAGTPDAAPVGSPDAASTAITAGLGKTCTAPTDCAAPTQGCLGPGMGQPGICSGICKDGYVVTSDASGGLALPPASDSSHQTCVNMFSGTVGIPVCGVITSISPPVAPGSPPAPNTEYTLQLACGLMADSGVCPSNLTPDAQGFCNP